MNSQEKAPIRVHVREAEMRYLHENREFLEANHAGEWVALEGDRLLAVGKDLAAVRKEAAAKGVMNPLVTAVKRKDYQNVYIVRSPKLILNKR
jgi:hypothetical protein